MIGCSILGATGTVGQRFAQFLEGHPDLEVRSLVGSSGRVGKRYADTVSWHQDTPVPFGDMRVEGLPTLQARDDVDVVFSALPGGDAGPIETALAKQGFKVFTNAKDHRMDPTVPLLIPEVNPDDLQLVDRQPGPGWIVANGNCSGIVLTLALAALKPFGLQECMVTTMQGLSGAGYPGVSAMDVLDNVIPYIRGEEDKLRTEPQKTLGVDFPVHATCTRVPVRDGHFESVQVRLKDTPSVEAAAAAFANFRGPDEVANCLHAPKQPIHVATAQDRPQPRRDRDAEEGMAITVGRLEIQGPWLRFLVLGHNTVRGAAGQSVLNAEYARAVGRL